MNERYNTGTSDGYIKALDQLHYYKSIGAIIEMPQIKMTRSTKQNAALHLFFTWCSNSLNDAGIEYKYTGLKLKEIEIPWTPSLFKEMTWKPIQKTLFEFESTTKLDTTQINTILDILTRFFAERGISINFPNQFDYWLKQIGY